MIVSIRRQPDRIETETAKQGYAIRFWCWDHRFALQPGENKIVDRIPYRTRIAHGGRGWTYQSNKGPLLFDLSRSRGCVVRPLAL